jgi:hypothetical protein
MQRERPKSYVWRRFWCPRDAAFSLSDGGYLYDPESEHGRVVNPDVVTFGDISAVPCLVLLGEPGIGKSTAIQAEYDRLTQELQAVGESPLRLDLKEYASDVRRIDDSFESDTFRAWLDGSRVLHVFLDSLDEACLEIRNLATILSGQLKKYSSYVSRLRLRVACRTSDWPASLESALRDIWGEERLGVYELVPLRRRDVAAAAEAEGIEPDGFLAEIGDKEAQPLAINPITLRFLLGIYRDKHTFPSSKRALYDQGCLALCEETSESRRDARHFGLLSSSQRLAVASRIAAVSVLCSRPVVFMGLQGSGLEEGLISVADLAGAPEQAGDDRFNVGEAEIRDVLSTALFSSRGAQRLGFAHRTYAEFLAARYVSERDLDETQKLGLLCHPESSTPKVVPHLAETAAWVAGADDQVFQRIVLSDPQVLLRSDVSQTDERTKTALVASLLRGFEGEELDDADWELRWHYHKLKHSTLAAQIEPYIRDRTHNTTVRRFAIDLAEACHQVELIGFLIDVALDESEDPYIRRQAAEAVVEIGDDEARSRLRPLALGTAGDDPDDQLRGAALRGLWPASISAQELFACISRPRRESHLGAYHEFLLRGLSAHLSPEDLPIALRWCARQTPRRAAPWTFRRLMEQIVNLACHHLDVPEVLDSLAEYAASEIPHHGELLEDPKAIWAVNAQLRRRLVAAIVPKLTDFDRVGGSLVFGRLALIAPDDIEWLIQQTVEAPSPEAAQRWARLVRIRFSLVDTARLDAIVNACESNSVLANELADFLQAVPLGSPKAEELKRRYQEQVKWEREMAARRDRPLLEPPPPERVRHCLEKLEEGDLDWWWRLNCELQLEPTDTNYHHDLEPDLTKLPGWADADEATRTRILLGAKRYVTGSNTEPGEWLGKRIFHHRDFAGYRALVLVKKLHPAWLQTLPPAAPEILWPALSGFERPKVR